MSSVAYATEEILLILVLAGTAAIHLAVPLAIAIAGLLLIVAVSYQQTIHAYPSGGGSYIVARANLGSTAGLVAAAALLIDYVLTVAVSVAAGVAALTSAVPVLLTHRVALGVGFVALIAFANLRGVRESGRDVRGAHLRLHRDLRGPGRGRPLPHASRRSPALARARSRGIDRADLVPDAARLFFRLHGPDRGRGYLERRAGLQAARVTQRIHHDGLDGRHPGRALPRDHRARAGDFA